jgi:coenzyme F420-reducing hydrogenase delta subunit
VGILKSLLETFGLDSERVWLRWVGHGEGKRFVDTANEFNDHIKDMGQNPLAKRRDT